MRGAKATPHLWKLTLLRFGRQESSHSDIMRQHDHQASRQSKSNTEHNHKATPTSQPRADISHNTTAKEMSNVQ